MQMQMQMQQQYMQMQQRAQENAMARQRVVAGLQSELQSIIYRLQQAQYGMHGSMDLGGAGGGGFSGGIGGGFSGGVGGGFNTVPTGANLSPVPLPNSGSTFPSSSR
jgi:hypothetical protein